MIQFISYIKSHIHSLGNHKLKLGFLTLGETPVLQKTLFATYKNFLNAIL